MNDLIFGKVAEGYLGSCKTKSSTEVLCQAIATEVAGKYEETSEGDFIITSTLGNIVKYLYSKDFITLNLNTHCALVAVNAPMYENEREVQIIGCAKTNAEWKAGCVVREIKASLCEGMNDEVTVQAVDFLDLMRSEQPVWTVVGKDATPTENIWKEWFYLVNHHNKCKVTLH